MNTIEQCCPIICVPIIPGITGNVKVDNNGDREPDYWIWDLVPGENTYNVSLEASLTSSDAKVNVA